MAAPYNGSPTISRNIYLKDLFKNSFFWYSASFKLGMDHLLFL